MSIPHGCGAIVSTPNDSAFFISALFNNKLVSENSLVEMINTAATFFSRQMKWSHVLYFQLGRMKETMI